MLQLIQINKWNGGIYDFWNDTLLNINRYFVAFVFLGGTWKDLGLETCMITQLHLFYHV